MTTRDELFAFFENDIILMSLETELRVTHGWISYSKQSRPLTLRRNFKMTLVNIVFAESLEKAK